MINAPIGILDSGVGGLTVWREVVKELPDESTIYVADSKNAPYGGKSSEEVFLLAKRIVEFLLQKNAKIIIIACNTITVSGIDRLRKEYPLVPIIGTVPVIKKAAGITQNKKIGIFSTTRTAKSSYQKDLIRKYALGCEVISVGSDALVPLIECGRVEGDEIAVILKEVLLPFKKAVVDTLCLGCTHFPFVENEIKKILGKKVTLLEPSSAIARHARNVLAKENKLAHNENKVNNFYTTGDKEQFKKVAKTLLQGKIQAEQIRI